MLHRTHLLLITVLAATAGACGQSATTSAGAGVDPALHNDGAATTAGTPGVSPADEAAVDKLVNAELPDVRVWIPLEKAALQALGAAMKPGEKPAAEALAGPIGPTDAAALALVAVGSGPSHLAGFLLVPAPVGGASMRVDLPELDTHQHAQVEWVAFLNADEDDDFEVVVRATAMTDVGPDGAVPYSYVAVIDWDGKAATRLAASEKVLEGVVTPVEAEMRLGHERFRANRVAGRFAGPCRETTGDQVTTYAYDADGRLVREASPSEERDHRYAANGRLSETVTSYKDGPPVTTRYTVDARGLVVASREVMAGEGGAPVLVAAVNTYDARGHLVREASIDATGAHHVTYTWEGRRMVGSDHDYPDTDEFCAPTPPTRHEEDATGRTLREEFRNTPGMCEEDRDETWRYDGAGNLVEHRVHPLTEGATDTVTTYDYGCWLTPAP